MLVKVHLKSKEEHEEFYNYLYNKGFTYKSGKNLSNVEWYDFDRRFYYYPVVDFNNKIVFYIIKTRC